MSDPVIRKNPVLVTDRTADIHEDYFSSSVYREMPLGLQSTAKMSMMVKKASPTVRLKQRKFHWWWKAFEQGITDVTDVFNGPGLTNGTSTASADGAVRIVQVSAADATKWQVGQLMRVTKFNDAAFQQVVSYATGVVTDKTIGSDTTSYVTIKLQSADSDNALAGTYLKATPSGQRNTDVHSLPEASFEDVTKRDGAMSTFLGAYEFNDYADLTESRANYPVRLNAMQDALKNLMIQKEFGFLEGIYKDTATYTSAGGLEYYITQHQPATGQQLIDALTDTTYLSSSNTGPAYTWIYELIEGLMAFMSETNPEGEYHALCGGEAGMVVNQMFRDRGTYNLGQTTTVSKYGFKATQLETQNGSIVFHQHPLFKRHPARKGSIVILDPKKIKTYEFIPLQHIGKDLMKSAIEERNAVDGTTWSSNNKAGFRECCGWEFTDISSMAVINNVHTKLNRS